jgi:hypothetical protein
MSMSFQPIAGKKAFTQSKSSDGKVPQLLAMKGGLPLDSLIKVNDATGKKKRSILSPLNRITGVAA